MCQAGQKQSGLVKVTQHPRGKLPTSLTALGRVYGWPAT